MVRVGDPAKVLARKFKSCEWMPKSLSRLTRLVLHEQILYHKQVEIDRRSAAKSIRKKTKSSRLRKWKYRAMKNRKNGVDCASVLDCRPMKISNPDDVSGNTPSNDTVQFENVDVEESATLDQTSDHNPEYISSSVHCSANDAPGENSVHHTSKTLLLETDHRNLQSGVTKSNNETSQDIFESDDGRCRWRARASRPSELNNSDRSDPITTCLPENRSTFPTEKAKSACSVPSESSNMLLRMQYKRDNSGNWKYVERNVPFNRQAKPLLFRRSLPRSTSVSEFHHKLSTISHHKPPKITKSGNRNQSIVQNFFKTFRKSKEKRRKSVFNSSKSLLFSSSYLPSFEEVGFAAINPSPVVFADTPKLQQVSMSRRRKSVFNKSRLVSKPDDTVMRGSVSNSTNLDKNRAAATKCNERPTHSSSFTATTNLHTNVNSNLPLWDLQNEIRTGKKNESCDLISAESAEFAVTALNLSLLYPPARDNMFTSFERMLAESTSEVAICGNLQSDTVNDDCMYDGMSDLWSILHTPTDLSEKPRQSLKLLDKVVVTASSNFHCSYATTEYKYHLSYESVFAIMNSLAQKCKPGQFCDKVTKSLEQINWADGKLWKSDYRLSTTLKYCFTSRSMNPSNRYCNNKQIGKALVRFRKFCDMVASRRLLKKKKLKYHDDSKTEFHQYWWSVPSHDLHKKNQAGSFQFTKSKSNTNMDSKRVLGKEKSYVFDEASSSGSQSDWAQNLLFPRLRSDEKFDFDSNTTKTTRHSNHDDKIPDNAGYYRIMSSPDNHMQPEMPRKENKRKRKLDTTNHKRICALITTDESNMKRYAKTGKTEQHARCLQPLFESSLNIHSVNRVLYDSANAKSFSLVPSEFMQNTPAVFKLGNQSLPLLQVSGDGLDPKDGDKVKSWSYCRSAYVPLEKCSSVTTKLGTAISTPHSRCRQLPCLLRFSTRPCSPKGLSKAKHSRVLWDFDRRGRRPKNVGVRTLYSKHCTNRQPLRDIDQTAMKLFGKIPVIIIPKCKI